MSQGIGQVALVVREYDEALDFYVGTLGFTLVEDTYIPEPDKRWVVVAPPGASESRLLLARAGGEQQVSRIGNQTGGRVFLFLYTDDFWRDFHAYEEPKPANSEYHWILEDVKDFLTKHRRTTLFVISGFINEAIRETLIRRGIPANHIYDKGDWAEQRYAFRDILKSIVANPTNPHSLLTSGQTQAKIRSSLSR